MAKIFHAIEKGDFAKIKRIVTKYPKILHSRLQSGETPLDVVIARGELEIAQYLWKEGFKVNLEVYSDGKNTPVHRAVPHNWWVSSNSKRIARQQTLQWVFSENVLPLDVLNVEDYNGWTPLDVAIAEGKLEMAKFLFEKGGRPNLDIYSDEKLTTPVHETMYHCRDPRFLKWLFTKNILPLHVLQIKNYSDMRTPLERYPRSNSTTKNTVSFLQDLIRVDAVFLMIQLAKRDHRCILRRLPNELLDMIMDMVAEHFNLVAVYGGGGRGE